MKKDIRRIESIDIVKGLCIILVIFGHSGNKVPLIPNFWYSFYMSAFFLFSGYLFKYKETTKKTIIHKIKSMYLLYLIWTIIPYSILGITRIIRGKLEIVKFIKIVGKIVLGIKCPREVAQMWFICALFTVEILWIIIDKVFKTKKRKIVVSILLMIIGIVFNMLDIKELVFRVDTALIMLPIFELGILYQRNKENKIINSLVYMKLPLLISLTIVYIILVILHFNILKYTVSIAANDYGLFILFYINALLGTLLSINYARKIYNKSKYIFKKILEYFMFIGTNSTISYITMNILIYLNKNIIEKLFSLNKSTISIITFISMLVIQIPLIKLLKNKRCKYLLAKF